ncbi:aminotransferase class IV [Rubritalea spongiae]|uniref:branched-chain-amino-acid transaminase n=1 Tax=Rubritalea spongiae TaxID=430797 RepID=A0ABW5E0D9_9BACT
MTQVRKGSVIDWVDGVYQPAYSAILASGDLGLSVGLGLFDSLCGYAGRPFDFEKHYKRLAHDASRCEFEVPERVELEQVLIELMKCNGFTEGRCRLRVSIYSRGNGGQSVVVSATDLPQRGEYSSVILSPYKVNEHSPLTGVKSTSYAANYLALKEAQAEGADEAILLNTSGFLCEGATSNIFLVSDGEIYTPSLSSGCLPGVTRDTVLEIAEEIGVVSHVVPLTVEELEQCDEAFLTSSLREVQPIVEINGREMGTVNGEVVQRLREVYQKKAWH